MARSNVRNLRPPDGGGEPPDMEHEQRLRHLEKEVHTIRETMVTKGEFYQAMNAQTWKMVAAYAGTMSIMTAIFTAIVKWL